MNLYDVFSAVAYKELVAVDLPHLGSNQHEMNGNAALRSFFGTGQSTKGDISWHFFADDQEPAQEIREFTFYDAREKSAPRTGRSEWRFYYYGDFPSRASVGDWLFLARAKSGKLFGLIFEAKSAWLRAAQSLFRVRTPGEGFDQIDLEGLQSRNLELAQRRILSELDLDILIPIPPTDADLMLRHFGESLPKTKEMSDFARTQADTDPARPDETLISWLDREEQLFRALEGVIIRQRLDAGFDSVDDFLEYSLSVQNRRKSRMGYALQNHLAELFTREGVLFTPQARTEGNNKPDFIFPGEREYHDPSFDVALLTMLGVKSTSKDRWRQVLEEADKIRQKHLCTLEQGISERQTSAMGRRGLVLVIPEPLLNTYTPDQRREILSLGDFIEFVRTKQNTG